MGLTRTTRGWNPSPPAGDAVGLFVSAVERCRYGVLVVNQQGLLPDHPYAAMRPQLAVVSQLRQLHLAGAMRLVVFTDRQWTKVANCLGCTPPPEIWGVGGLERARPDAAYEGPAITADQQQALTTAYDLADQYGLQPWAERKPGGVGLYLNGFTAVDAQALGGRLWRPWSRIATRAGLEIAGVKHGIELRVPGRKRQEAVQVILSEVEPNTPLAYIGTDVLDEPALHALRGRGLTAFFGTDARRTKADVELNNWAAFSDFLELWQAATQVADFPQPETCCEADRSARKEKWDEQAQGDNHSRRSGKARKLDRVCPEVPATRSSALM